MDVMILCKLTGNVLLTGFIFALKMRGAGRVEMKCECSSSVTLACCDS